jgi:CheY-like chemotaxis protein
MAMIAMADEKISAVAPRDVLVVDDNRDAANSLAMVVRLKGHRVRQAYNGADAIAIAQEQKPDIILLDIGLPRMNGYAVVEHLRKQPETRDALIIAVTGYGQPSDRVRSKQAGFDLHWLKPIDSDLLLGLLDGDTSALVA